MLIGFLIVAARAFRSLNVRALMPGLTLAVAASAAAALLIVAGSPQPPQPAGAMQVQRIAEDHALAADSQAQRVEAERAANLVVTQEGARMRQLAAALESRPAQATTHVATQVALAVPLPRPARAARDMTPSPVQPAAGPPLPLQVASAAPPVAPPAVPKRPAVGPVRAVVAAVGRIPRWVGAGVINVADWVVEVPVQTLARLPERRFL